LISLQPWWVGAAIAAVGYFWLHRIAVSPAAPGDISSAVFRGLATGGQYLVPLIGSVGAVVSYFRRRRRGELVSSVTQSKSQDSLSGMSWREFEVLVAEGFKLQGYHVVETGGGGPDGGIDMVLSRPGANGTEKYLVQCKQWRAFKVGVDVVRELYGVMAARGAAGGFVVTSGQFTGDAVSFARGRNVQLVDGPKLHGLLQQARKGRKGEQMETPPLSGTPATQSAPQCPVCSAQMVRRTARRGASAGGEFWGCGRYPGCRGTRPIS
jgi:restriction system protein